MPRFARSLVICGALIAAPAAADDQPQTSTWGPPAEPSTAPAPRPDQASGVAIPEGTSAAETALWVPRAALFVPRWAFWLAMQPARGAAYTYERYQLGERFRGALFNVNQTYGVYPVASYSTDYGFSIGARAVHYNLFGEHEKLRLHADWGGEFRQGYGMSLSSGDRIAHIFGATIDARFQRRPGERFFGIGNDDELQTPPAMPVDPTTSNAVIESRFREDAALVKVGVDARVWPLIVRASGSYAHRRFANAETDGIATRFDTSRLIGYTGGVDNFYVEGEVVYDSRRQPNELTSQAIDATGWYAAAHLGRAHGLDEDTTAFTRYGGELARFIDLYGGTRVLTLRVLTDAIAGSDGRTDGKISFVDLPRLGGPELLRGYPIDRFRDRIIMLGTAEYTWDIGNYLAAYTFIDAGRVARTYEAFTARSLHVGFGAGVQVHTYRSFLMRGQLAASEDGDVFLEIALAPAFGRRERAVRY